MEIHSNSPKLYYGFKTNIINVMYHVHVCVDDKGTINCLKYFQ